MLHKSADDQTAHSTGRRNTLLQKVAMTTGKRRSEQSIRGKLRSPGRPPIWQRESMCRFWRAVASGISSENAAIDAGVSGPVGVRWFRSSGGMPPTQLSPSAKSITSRSRSRSFKEREEIALERAPSPRWSKPATSTPPSRTPI